MESITVTWYVEDGYVGQKRPQSTKIYLEDLEGLEGDDLADAVEAAIEDDFERKINYHYDQSVLSEIKNALEGDV